MYDALPVKSSTVSVLTYLYIVYADYVNKQAQKDLETIKYELQALGACGIDLGTTWIDLGVRPNFGNE